MALLVIGGREEIRWQRRAKANCPHNEFSNTLSSDYSSHLILLLISFLIALIYPPPLLLLLRFIFLLLSAYKCTISRADPSLKAINKTAIHLWSQGRRVA